MKGVVEAKAFDHTSCLNVIDLSGDDILVLVKLMDGVDL